MPKVKRQTFLHGALILSVATALVKIIGALFKVPLGNLIGPEGMTNFNMAYNVYSTLFVISSAGLPVAVSKMVSEAGAHNKGHEMRRIFQIAMVTFVSIGVAGSLFMFFFAHTLAGWMHNPDAYYAILAISPSIFLVAVMSAFRGYYQGQGNMYPTAISQVIEALGKLFIGYALAAWIYRSGLGIERAAGGAIAGVSVGALGGALYLYFTRRRQSESLSAFQNPQCRPKRVIFKELLRLAIPVTISASVLSFTNLIDASVVMGRLQMAANLSFEQAKTLYGSFTFSNTLFNVPPAFILTISVSVIPALSRMLAKNDRAAADNTIRSSLRITALLSMPAAAGLIALSYPILSLLYGRSQPEAVTLAAPLLSMLGFSVFFVCLVSLTNAILQSMGRVDIPIFTMLIGGLVKIVTNYVLVGLPSVNIAGAPIGTLLCYGVIAALNMISIARLRSSCSFLLVFWKPAVAAVAMGFFTHYLYLNLTGAVGLSQTLSLFVSIAAACVLYFSLVLVLRAIPKEDMLLLPRGEKLARLLRL